jgi:hypothetical protein
MSPKRSTYETEIPDTLDLAQRARWGVNALVEVVDRSRGLPRAGPGVGRVAFISRS